MPLGQTITVVNKSGKIVSSSKQLVNVWKEAKAAYRERKAELNATRQVEWEQKRAERRALKHLEDDKASQTSSKRSKQPHRTRKHPDRPTVDRGYTDSFYANDNEHVSGGTRQRSTPRSPLGDDMIPIRNRELVRRRTEGEYLTRADSHQRRHSSPQVNSARSSVDLDLAYGDIPPPMPQTRYEDEEELRGQMSKLTMMLNEANCLQYSVTTMVEHLQKNPDALAAVALTLAEISNLAAKMAPGALAALKGSFPAVIALLASPQFLIAAGLGVGVTVVMLGGYKIIKRIKNKTDEDRELEAPVELEPLEDVDLSRIELWRQGIADVELDSPGSTVDGEFITPDAREHLTEAGILPRQPGDTKSTKSGRSKTSHRHRKSGKDDASSKSERPAGSSSAHRKGEEAAKSKKKKAPSGLRMLFPGSTH